MEPHPLADAMPPMSAVEFAELKASIGEHGLAQPIVRFRGKTLDGRHRVRALEELGVPRDQWKVRDFDGTTEQAAALVQVLNLDRRNLSDQQKREARAELVRKLRDEGMSTRAIADAVGVSDMQVRRDLKQVRPDVAPEPPPPAEPAPEPDEPAETEPAPPTPPPAPKPAAQPAPPKVTGKDGKQYAATRPQKPASRVEPARKPEAKTPEPQNPSTEKPPPPWAAVAEQLARVAALIEAVPEQEEDEPWKLVESLEKAARTLLRKAHALRQRHHL